MESRKEIISNNLHQIRSRAGRTVTPDALCSAVDLAGVRGFTTDPGHGSRETRHLDEKKIALKSVQL